LYRSNGFSSIELLVGMTISLIGIAMASGLVIAGKSHIRDQERELETTQGSQASLIAILRELRLGGACLPDTGEFIALEAVDNGTRDEIVTRYGLTSANDLSCLQSTTTAPVMLGDTSVVVSDTTGLDNGMLAYIRHPDGSGEYFVMAGVDPTTGTLSSDRTFAAPYPATSGIYAIDERHFFVADGSLGVPELMIQVDGGTARSFAIGVEALDVQYKLSDGSLVGQPTGDTQWRSLNEVLVSITARSFYPNEDGTYYRRTYSTGVKPRNLVDG